MSESELIQVSKSGGVMEISIQRPDRKNALTHAMYAAMNAALVTAEQTPATRVVLITGTADCFTAGNDMVDFLSNPPEGREAPVMCFLRQLVEMKKPVVAAVNGAAVGVGTTMLLHCDLVYVARSAKLQMPFASLGLCPEAASSMLLPMIMGHQRAAELLLLGTTISGEEAVRLGIANQLAEDAEYLLLAREKALQLAAQPAAAVRMTKQLLKAPYLDQLKSHMQVEGDLFFQRLSSPEAKEAMSAFMEKRKPDFSSFS
tara:strand:- start:34637 stop:35413 length:777 start_codon:yes stop_codon:yes gene_type:complete